MSALHRHRRADSGQSVQPGARGGAARHGALDAAQRACRTHGERPQVRVRQHHRYVAQGPSIQSSQSSGCFLTSHSIDCMCFVDLLPARPSTSCASIASLVLSRSCTLALASAHLVSHHVLLALVSPAHLFGHLLTRALTPPLDSPRTLSSCPTPQIFHPPYRRPTSSDSSCKPLLTPSLHDCSPLASRLNSLHPLPPHLSCSSPGTHALLVCSHPFLTPQHACRWPSTTCVACARLRPH